jgi:hypothetical protein
LQQPASATAARRALPDEARERGTLAEQRRDVDVDHVTDRPLQVEETRAEGGRGIEDGAARPPRERHCAAGGPDRCHLGERYPSARCPPFAASGFPGPFTDSLRRWPPLDPTLSRRPSRDAAEGLAETRRWDPSDR